MCVMIYSKSLFGTRKKELVGDGLAGLPPLATPGDGTGGFVAAPVGTTPRFLSELASTPDPDKLRPRWLPY